ncbi:hypothetical protein L9F63_019772 [Diploptera punctata]|uniref:Uncharacterized protein n=1 Tax=Diploptera punctata TaxID=6984 RepID=A0AAD7ZV08_DIPPU|nr:hypothetical protein L9F63_019772 [Diploptera punctata]
MWCLTLVLLTAFLSIAFTSPLPDYLSDASVPSNTGLRPVIIKHTQVFGYAEDRGGRALIAPKMKPERSCSCPRSDGWTSDQLESYRKKTLLVGNPQDCFCYGPNGYFLKPRFQNTKK